MTTPMQAKLQRYMVAPFKSLAGHGMHIGWQRDGGTSCMALHSIVIASPELNKSCITCQVVEVQARVRALLLEPCFAAHACPQ